VSPAQLSFARALAAGMWCGLAVLALGFAAYVSGLVPSTLPLDTLPQYWGVTAAEFRRVTATPDGWGWLARFGAGETLPLAGIVILCVTVPAACIAMIAACARQRDWVYAAIVTSQFAVLLLAASGVITAH
jgi:hypothetical protein